MSRNIKYNTYVYFTNIIRAKYRRLTIGNRPKANFRRTIRESFDHRRRRLNRGFVHIFHSRKIRPVIKHIINLVDCMKINKPFPLGGSLKIGWDFSENLCILERIHGKVQNDRRRDNWSYCKLILYSVKIFNLWFII